MTIHKLTIVAIQPCKVSPPGFNQKTWSHFPNRGVTLLLQRVNALENQPVAFVSIGIWETLFISLVYHLQDGDPGYNKS